MKKKGLEKAWNLMSPKQNFAFLQIKTMSVDETHFSFFLLTVERLESHDKVLAVWMLNCHKHSSQHDKHFIWMYVCVSTYTYVSIEKHVFHTKKYI